MVKTKRQKNKFSFTNQLFNVTLLIWLTFSCAQRAYSEENISEPPNRSTLRLAPVRFAMRSGGNLDYTLFRDARNTNQTLGLTVYSSLRAYSFFWQPWIAPFNTGVTALLNSNNTRSSSGLSKSANVQVTGDISLQLLPRGRTPTTVAFSRSRNRTIYGASNNGTDGTTQLRLEQGYRSRNFMTIGNMSLTHTLIDGVPSAVKKTDGFNLSIGHQLSQQQNIDVNGTVTREFFPNLIYRSLVESLIAKHSYKPNSVSSLRSAFNSYAANYQQLDKTTRSNYQQFSSVGYFAISPAVTVTGNARVSQSVNADRTSNMYLSTSYALSKTMRASGSLNVSDRMGIQILTTSFSLSASKGLGDSTTTKMGSLSYKRYLTAGISGSNSVVTNDTASQSVSSSQGVSLSLALGHSLTSAKRLLYGGNLTSNVNQAIRASITGDSSGAPSLPLTTNGSMAWLNMNKDEAKTTVRFTASDYRNLNNSLNGRTSQVFNLQASHSPKAARYVSLGGNVTLQAAIYNGARTAHTNASLKYRHARAFQIPRMIFSSTLSAQRSLLRNEDIANQAQLVWDNNLTYLIGLTSLALDVNMSRTGQSTYSYLQFRLRRQF